MKLLLHSTHPHPPKKELLCKVCVLPIKFMLTEITDWHMSKLGWVLLCIGITFLGERKDYHFLPSWLSSFAMKIFIFNEWNIYEIKKESFFCTFLALYSALSSSPFSQLWRNNRKVLMVMLIMHILKRDTVKREY